jgi:hypothetical protein
VRVLTFIRLLDSHGLYYVSGKVLLCVLPAIGPDALHSVKWHPKQEDTMSVASETAVYLLSVTEASQIFGGEPIDQLDLQRIGQNISLPSVSY